MSTSNRQQRQDVISEVLERCVFDARAGLHIDDTTDRMMRGQPFIGDPADPFVEVTCIYCEAFIRHKWQRHQTAEGPLDEMLQFEADLTEFPHRPDCPLPRWRALLAEEGKGDGLRGDRRLPQAQEPQPSTCTADNWLWTERFPDGYPAFTERSGKWLVFVPVADVDTWWAKIKRATQSGRLGGRAKVSTARPNSHAINDRERVICVYTYDGYDQSDMMRVREELRQLGVTWAISYKLDSTTRAGQYAADGARVSLYRV